MHKKKTVNKKKEAPKKEAPKVVVRPASVNGLKIKSIDDVKFENGVKMKKITYIDGSAQHKTKEELESALD